MMNILSLNCNKFGGKNPNNGKGEIYDELIVEKLTVIIKFFLDTNDKNVIFLNEINNAKDNMSKFKELFDEEIYTIHEPKNFEKFNKKNHPYGCTIAITKNNSFWQNIDSLYLEKDLSYANKSVILKHDDIILIGIHMPYDINYWDKLINYFLENTDKNIYILGDLNICADGTDRKEKFIELKNNGAIDVWVKKGNQELHTTYNKGGRLDYVLTSPKGYNTIKKMSYIDSFRLNELSDHSGIFLELIEFS